MMFLVTTTKNSCENKDCYLEIYGRHFNEKLCNFALSLMNHPDKPNNLSLEQVQQILKNFNIKLDYNYPYDILYIANMGYHDYFGSCIEDERHLAYYIKDIITDNDGYEGISFCRWIADIKAKLIDINWNLMI